jgi:hypothetical protein
MITEKLDQAKQTVENWLTAGMDGNSAAKWQWDMLTKQADHDAAEALAVWWMSHPKHPANQ